MAGIVDYLKQKKEGFMSGMHRLERWGRGAVFGPQGSDKMKMRKRRLQQAAGGAVDSAGKAAAAAIHPRKVYKPKRSMKKMTKGR
jgi:hypothetical protein